MIEISPQIELPRGDARVLPFSVTDSDTGDVVDLTDAEIDWGLYTRAENTPVLELSDPGVSIQTRDNTNGAFEIKLDSTTTTDLDLGLYKEYLTITDENGNRTTFIGQIQLLESPT